jgi:RNA polymerase sigma-70 factor (ECF subfamily)
VSPIDDPRSDSELVDAANRGDASAFDALYRRHRDWVLALAWRFCAHREDALDVLQESFVYLLRKFPGFRLSAKLTTLLYPVVKHLSLERRKQRRRFAGEAEPAPEPLAPPPRAEGEIGELAEALRGLSDEHREVVLLRFVDALDLEEIGTALSIPLGTVKSRLHFALAKLREDPRARRYFLGGK